MWWAKLAYLDIPFICAAIDHFTVQDLGIYSQHRRLVFLSWAVSAIVASSILWSDALVADVYRYWWQIFIFGVPRRA